MGKSRRRTLMFVFVMLTKANITELCLYLDVIMAMYLLMD